MAEKATTTGFDSYDEKSEAPDRQASLTESAGRRKSVALNIVENPLKVSLALS